MQTWTPADPASHLQGRPPTPLQTPLGLPIPGAAQSAPAPSQQLGLHTLGLPPRLQGILPTYAPSLGGWHTAGPSEIPEKPLVQAGRGRCRSFPGSGPRHFRGLSNHAQPQKPTPQDKGGSHLTGDTGSVRR